MDERPRSGGREPFLSSDARLLLFSVLTMVLVVVITLIGLHRLRESPMAWGVPWVLLPLGLFSLPLILSLRAHRDKSLRLAGEIQERIKAEAALRRTEATLGAVFASAPIGIATLQDRCILRANTSFCRMFGRSPEELLGRNTRMLYASAEDFEALGSRVYTRKHFLETLETTGLRGDGSTFPMLIQTAALEPGRPDSTAIVLVTMDITAQKATEAALRASEARLQLVLDTMPQAVFWKDCAGNFLGCNETFAHSAGIQNPSDIVGLNDFAMPWAEFAEAYRAEDRTILESGKAMRHIPGPFRDVEGRDISLDFTKVPLENEQGDVIGILGVFEDITERKRVEDELAQSRTFADAVMDSIPGLFYVFDAEERLVRWNRRYEERTGYVVEEIQGFHLRDWFQGDEEEITRVRAAMQQVFQQGQAEVEARLTLKDGRRIPFYLNAVGLEIAGQPYVIGVGLDMTERKKAEEELRQSQEKFRTIFDASPISISLIDPETGAYTDANARLCVSLGLSKEEIIGKTATQLGLTLDEDSNREAMQVLKREGAIEDMDLKVTIPGHGNRTLLVTARTISMGGRDCTLAMAMDITERKRAERAIQESERRWRTLFVGSPIGMFRSTPEGQYLQVNPALATMFRYDDPLAMVEEVNRQGIPEALYEFPEQRSDLLQRLRASLGTWFVEEIHFRRKDGSFIDGIMSILMSPDPDTGHPMLVGFVQDITGRKRSEQEILHLKNYLANVIDSMPTALAGLDRDGRVTQWNRAAADLLGVPAPEALGRSFEELAKEFAPWIEALREEVQRERRPASMDKLLLERKGEWNFYELMLYPLVADVMEGSVVHIQDVTERVHIQALMIQTEKMISVGGLAAGMAHEINNPLGIISQAAQNIRRRLSAELPANRAAAQEIGLDLGLLHAYFEKRKISRFMGGIQEAVDRATRIVANMLQFSRQADAVRHPASLPELMDQALGLAANDYDLKKKYDFRSIEIHREFDPELPAVPVVAIEIEQVLLNLFKNAAQAMAANPLGRRPCLVLRIHRDSKHAVMEIEDNGPGMIEAIRRRVFEPFFTTKEPGLGTGLGLSVSYTIITQNHKGVMEVASAPGQGTRFTVRLPLKVEREDARGAWQDNRTDTRR